MLGLFQSEHLLVELALGRGHWEANAEDDAGQVGQVGQAANQVGGACHALQHQQ